MGEPARGQKRLQEVIDLHRDNLRARPVGVQSQFHHELSKPLAYDKKPESARWIAA
ncbi:hypothetical protein Tchar_01901 [Tepidimonas charontis]|uniref:Uncharacterized protein n=1 Tax=Tepidimonas charontis TaxID=2267262 RepID=A0A554XB07_9BURK|nr:hypothetical protein Tchar_01901 [Tepidimonas charontis]